MDINKIIGKQINPVDKILGIKRKSLKQRSDEKILKEKSVGKFIIKLVESPGFVKSKFIYMIKTIMVNIIL